MAFIKLFPPEGREALSVKQVIRRLREEFKVVDADPDAGQDHVAGMIAATLRFSDSLPGKQERLAWLQSIRAISKSCVRPLNQAADSVDLSPSTNFTP